MDLIDEPRLVRLNPNVPTKTRGNAALVARFGHGRGASRIVGQSPEGPVRAFAGGSDVSPAECDRLVERLWATVQDSSALGDPGTDPALVVARRRPPAALYWEAVRRIVTPAEVDSWLEGTEPQWRSAPSGLGKIGAAAALAWPGGHPTWEVITYRPQARWASRRDVDTGSVLRAARRHPRLFQCFDARTRRLLIAPHTRCPILFGLRATDAGEAIAALREVRSEPYDRWMLFRTNQGTGDHVRRPWPLPSGPYTTGTLSGRLVSVPVSSRGGHLFFEVDARPNLRVRCAVFEPTKTLPQVVRALLPGDRVRLWGGSHDDALFRVEGVDVVAWGPRRRPGPNPACPACARQMGSLGRGRGFRCGRCRLRLPPERRGVEPVPPAIPLGRYHPTPSARRHLSPRGPEPEIPRGRMN